MISCSGNGLSRGDRAVLLSFSEEIEACKEEHGIRSEGLEGPAEIENLISVNTKCVEIIDVYLAREDCPDAARGPMESWRQGLLNILEIHRAWIEEGRGRDEATPEEIASLENNLKQIMDGEAYLRSALED